MKKLFLILLFNSIIHSVKSHPGVGIVKNSKGEIFYTDTEKVWKILADGKNKLVVVPNVHTHQLYLDKNDNLYGEHLWYEGEKSNKWGHFVWKFSQNGTFTKEIADTEGFLKNYSFNRDADGNMYWLEEGKIESIFMKKFFDGKIEAVVSFKTKDVRWKFCQKNGTFYFVDDNDLYKIENKKVVLVAQDLDDVEGEKTSRKPNNSTFGIWDDNSGNIYVALISKEQIRKISIDGKMSVAYKSKVGWMPTGGLFDDKNNLWVLENNHINQVKVVKVSSNDLKETNIQKSNTNDLIINILYTFIGLSFVGFIFYKLNFFKKINFLISTKIAFILLFSTNLFAQKSGLEVGTDAPAFDPIHVSGADKGKKVCPMCKYGSKTDGIMIWLNDDLKNYEKMLSFLEGQYLTKNPKNWKVFVMYMNPEGKSIEEMKRNLSAFSEKIGLKNVALTFIPSPTDPETAGEYKINPKVKNTIFLYEKRIISKKFIDFKGNFSELDNR